MVTKEVAVEKLIKCFYHYQGDSIIKKLEEYLLGDREDVPTYQEFSSITFYTSSYIISQLECFDNIGQYIECEAGEVLKKLSTYIMKSNHRHSLTFFHSIEERYSLLKEIGASDEFVRRCLDYGHQAYLADTKSTKLLLLYQDRVVEFYVKQYCGIVTSRGIEIAISLLGNILNSVNGKDELAKLVEEKYKNRFEEFKLALEKITEGCFRKKYQNQNSKIKMLAESNEEFKDLPEIFEKTTEMRLEFVNNKLGGELLDKIIHINKFPTEKCEKLLKAFIILSPSESLYNRRNIEFVVMMMKRFNLDENYGIDYFYQRSCNLYDCEGIEKFIDRVVIEKPQLIKNRVFQEGKNKNIKSAYLFAKLLEKGMVNVEEKKEYLDWFENKIVEIYKDNIENKFNAEVEIAGKKVENLSFLKEKNFPEHITINVLNYNYHMKELIDLACIASLVIRESNIGINVIKLNMVLCDNLRKTYGYGDFGDSSALSYYSTLFSKRDLLEDFYQAGQDIERLLKVFVNSYYYVSPISDEMMYNFLKRYPEETNKALGKVKLTNVGEYKKLCGTVFRKGNPFDIKSVLLWIDESGLAVLKYMETILKNYPNEIRSYIEEKSQTKKKVIADFCSRLLRFWDNDIIERDLKDVEDTKEVTKYLEKFFTKKMEKNTLFADEIVYSDVREKNSDEKVDERLLKYYISEYMGLNEIYIINSCKKISEVVNIADLRILVQNIYEKWLDNGANPKQKNILLPMTLIASPAQLEMLKKQMNFWVDNSKPGLATFLIQCIATRGDKASLIYVDSIAKKFKNKKIKNLAQSALESTAELFGMSLEELEEKIIPDFEFDKDRVRYFNYGERKIKAVLGSNLEITLFDNTGKQIKSLPKASAKHNDDENLVAECKEELKVIKKQFKTVADLQKFKIQKAIIKRRKWKVERWKEIFIDNPLMNVFAIGLIWEEIDSDGEVLGRFRYMEDGSFNTVDEDEYELQENSFIVPANLREMEDDEKEAWKEQLEDYEITQPVEQLDIKLFNLTDEEKNSNELMISTDKEFYQATFKKIMDKYGFKYEQDYYDGIEKATYIDTERDLQATIFLKEPLMMWDYESKGKLEKIIFGKSGDEKSQYNLKDVPVEILDYIWFAIQELI